MDEILASDGVGLFENSYYHGEITFLLRETLAMYCM